uniref:Uncharacterized protein n=1 Tax=Timema cristinae TaxID=61476 RepID=A0A7R9D826_TIMCR|nr:unnamed protein product [Timema cristinae]
MELRFEDLTKLQIPDWILDPFSFEAVDKLDNSLQTEFLDLKYDCEAKIIFKQSGYELGWVKIMDTYPQLWGKTEPLLISFPSTYLVEKGFSSVVQLLTKQRNKLDICLKGDLRLNLTNIKPDIQALTEIHQGLMDEVEDFPDDLAYDSDEEEYDALNDETFGSDAIGESKI